MPEKFPNTMHQARVTKVRHVLWGCETHQDMLRVLADALTDEVTNSLTNPLSVAREVLYALAEKG